MMRNLSFWSLICVLLSTCGNPLPPHPANTVEDENTLRHLKKVLWPRAYATHDTTLLHQILAEDFRLIDHAGNWYNKADEIEWIKENATSHDSFHYEIKRLDIYPNGTAVVAGTGHMINDGEEAIYQSSNVLMKQGDAWQAVLSHVSGYREMMDTIQ